MNYATIKKCDIANGLGVRVSLFVSGCTHHCKGCFNAVAWDFSYGNKFDESTEQEIFNELDLNYVDGLSLLGGEPFEIENQKTLVIFLKKVKQRYPEKNIWCYTGNTLDCEKGIFTEAKYNGEHTKEMLSYIDILVDGEFVDEKKDISLKFRGSSNQRVLDLKKTLQQKKEVLLFS